MEKTEASGQPMKPLSARQKRIKSMLGFLEGRKAQRPTKSTPIDMSASEVTYALKIVIMSIDNYEHLDNDNKLRMMCQRHKYVANIYLWKTCH